MLLACVPRGEEGRVRGREASAEAVWNFPFVAGDARGRTNWFGSVGGSVDLMMPAAGSLVDFGQIILLLWAIQNNIR